MMLILVFMPVVKSHGYTIHELRRAIYNAAAALDNADGAALMSLAAANLPRFDAR
ncbi:hypothetical protein D3C79_1084520 [compost metagenome]